MRLLLLNCIFLVSVFCSRLGDDPDLHQWYPATLDTVYGGYFSDFAYNWDNTGPNDKFIVAQGRLLAMASIAGTIYRDDPRYREAADHGFVYLRDYMWDAEKRGFYTLLTREGNVPKDGYQDEKRLYGNSFAIYGLCAYYELTGNLEALNLAINTFKWLDEFAHDTVFGGYFQFLLRDGTPYGPTYNSTAPDSPATQAGFKDYNSGLHWIEALTKLYLIWPDDTLRARLSEMFYLMRDVVTNERGELQLFFYPSWTPFKYSSDEAAEKDHFALDSVTFGHNIETPYILLDANSALGNIEYNLTFTKTKLMLDRAIKDGYDNNIGGLYSNGYHFSNNFTETTVIDKTKIWWVNAEALRTPILFLQLFPDEVSYKNIFLVQWKYLKSFMIDPIFGGWYPEGIDFTPSANLEPKVNIWKLNYHDCRSLLTGIQLIN